MSGPVSRDLSLRARADAVIPGGMCRPQTGVLLPNDYPQFFSRGRGAYIWDADGRRYIDLMSGYGPNLLGYANKAVDNAAVRRLHRGDPLTGPTGLMVDLAEALTNIVSHAAWAIFCKSGSDAKAMALDTARAHTRRKIVLLAKPARRGPAPWCAQRPIGIAAEDHANQIYFDYNDVGSLEAAAALAGDNLAAIFTSPHRHTAIVDQALPELQFAHRARELCDLSGLCWSSTTFVPVFGSLETVRGQPSE